MSVCVTAISGQKVKGDICARTPFSATTQVKSCESKNPASRILIFKVTNFVNLRAKHFRISIKIHYVVNRHTYSLRESLKMKIIWKMCLQ